MLVIKDSSVFKKIARNHQFIVLEHLFNFFFNNSSLIHCFNKFSQKTANLPTSMKALVLKGPGNGAIGTTPVPQALPGSVIVRVLHVLVYQITPDVFHGTVANPKMTLPYPVVFGSPAIGRVAAIGPDTTAFKPGQLVLIDTKLRARDDPSVSAVRGAFDGLDETTKRFVIESWRDGAWAEYVRAPLESTWALDENKLIGNLELKTEDLLHLGLLPVMYSGLCRVGVKAGETVLIAPSTGVFSGGCIAVARAMGAKASYPFEKYTKALERG